MTATPQALELARIAAHAATERKAADIVVLDVSETLVITDLFLIASADNERQVNAITEEIEDRLREAGHNALRREGVRDGRWALLDYGDVVIHIQHDDEREFYGLQRLWADSPAVEIEGLSAPESDPA